MCRGRRVASQPPLSMALRQINPDAKKRKPWGHEGLLLRGARGGKEKGVRVVWTDCDDVNLPIASLVRTSGSNFPLTGWLRLEIVRPVGLKPFRVQVQATNAIWLLRSLSSAC